MMAAVCHRNPIVHQTSAACGEEPYDAAGLPTERTVIASCGLTSCAARAPDVVEERRRAWVTCESRGVGRATQVPWPPPGE
jgi:hypothetical protein